MRLLAALAIGWGALSARQESDDRWLEPPNSLQPADATVPVYVRHRHRAVVACQPPAQRSDGPCIAVFDERDARTSLRLEPVKARKLRHGVDSRKSVDVRIVSDGTPEAGAVLVAPGAWDVVWSGLPARKRFSAEAERAIGVQLATTTGRCERVAGQCLVRANATSKTVEITRR